MVIPTEQLPDWMRPHPRRINWALLALLLLSIPAVLPLLLIPVLSADNDSPLYIARSLQTASLLRSGILYSRWMPDMYNGLGSPLFNYLAPLPHYLAGVYELFTDTPATQTLRILTILSMVGAGVGMLFLAARWGQFAGLLAGLTYLYSAPVVYILPREKGDLASLMSLALFPYVLHFLIRLGRNPSRRDLVASVGMLALWALADTRLMLVGLIPVIIIAWFQPTSMYPLLALILAAFMTAFFWFPALAERQQVVWVQASINTNGEWIIPLKAAPAGFQPIGWQHLALGWGVPGLALSAGYVLIFLKRLPKQSIQRIVASILCTLPLIAAAPRLIPTYPIHIAENTVDERQTGIYGTLRDGVLLPETAFRPNGDITDIAFTRIQPPAPDRPTFPTKLGVIQVERAALSSRYTVDVSGNEYTRFDRYYFPGWGVAVNGANMELQPDAQGYAVFLVPPTARELLVYLGTTTPRVLGWFASFAGAILLIWQLRGRRNRESRRTG
jgi:hypothetical protein